jgi:hypothetical protein
MKWAIVTLTKSGSELGRKLSDKIPGSVLYTLPGRGDYLSEEIKGSLKELRLQYLISMIYYIYNGHRDSCTHNIRIDQ